jgi:hypothetical protein
MLDHSSRKGEIDELPIFHGFPLRFSCFYKRTICEDKNGNKLSHARDYKY